MGSRLAIRRCVSRSCSLRSRAARASSSALVRCAHGPLGPEASLCESANHRELRPIRSASGDPGILGRVPVAEVRRGSDRDPGRARDRHDRVPDPGPVARDRRDSRRCGRRRGRQRCGQRRHQRRRRSFRTGDPRRGDRAAGGGRRRPRGLRRRNRAAVPHRARGGLPGQLPHRGATRRAVANHGRHHDGRGRRDRGQPCRSGREPRRRDRGERGDVPVGLRPAGQDASATTTCSRATGPS